MYTGVYGRAKQTLWNNKTDILAENARKMLKKYRKTAVVVSNAQRNRNKFSEYCSCENMCFFVTIAAQNEYCIQAARQGDKHEAVSRRPVRLQPPSADVHPALPDQHPRTGHRSAAQRAGTEGVR